MSLIICKTTVTMTDGIDYIDVCKTDVLGLDTLHHTSVIRSPIPTITFDCLPYTILSNICTYLHQEELINFSLISKTSYLPAIGTLYLKIIVTDNIDLTCSVKKAIKKYPRFCGTIISISNFGKLLNCLYHNQHLAGLLRSLSLDLNQESVNLILLLGIVRGLKLQSLVAPDIPFSYFSMQGRLNLGTIKMLAVSAKDVGLTPLQFNELESLKIFYNETSRDKTNIRQLCKVLNEGNSLSKLRHLEFSESLQIKTSTFLNITNDDLDLDSIPAWAHFFDYFSNGKITRKLNLDSLAIEGWVGKKAKECMIRILSAVDLSKLNHLQLHVNEKYPKNEQHTSQRRLLDLITERTPALQSLAIKPTSDDLFIQHYTIIKTLKQNLVHQLKHLLLVFESPMAEQSLEVCSTICDCQHNLESLLILDRSTAVVDSELLHCCLSFDDYLLSLYDYGLIYEKKIVDLLFSDVLLTDFLKLDERFIINDYMLELARNATDKGLNDFLWNLLNYTFSSVTSNNFKLIVSLPALKLLNVLGISLVIRHDNGYLNDRVQGLYYNTNGRYSISCGSTYLNGTTTV